MHDTSHDCGLLDAGNPDWPRVSSLDNSTGSATWSGYDVELMKLVSTTLGFTYTFAPMTKKDGETWTALAYRYTKSTDMLISYWLHTPARRKIMTQLVGRIKQKNITQPLTALL